ncbi:flagellar biosynthetic protein FliO [Hyphococcus flavus]|uniref:Flagellar biosynthetic protein FliO n=1 Tax=Hyphococcus flavus TaxID=1866326 RepID=A0AAE9ZFB2_9PROT|nr:flagellar biosynthetic protein FliO [Hyphococcus flavus]WDI32002.1 flagellar biosynthetic protein FliO [Hyphococcus flavus]
MLASEIFRLIFGFAAVLGMIGICALAAKKAGLASMSGLSGAKRRLSMKEMLPIDARRRLAIVKCDDTEYLIVLGPNGETIIDKNLNGPDEEILAEAPAANPFAGVGDFAKKLRSVRKNAA